jgi:hypothetical protein
MRFLVIVSLWNLLMDQPFMNVLFVVESGCVELAR